MRLRNSYSRADLTFRHCCIHQTTEVGKCLFMLHRYARDHIEKLRAENQLGPRSRYASWIPVTATEMEGFFAVYGNHPGPQHRGLLEYRLDKPDLFLFEGFSKRSLSVDLLATPREP